jgi:predicted MFS family arabinose efflux permease
MSCFIDHTRDNSKSKRVLQRPLELAFGAGALALPPLVTSFVQASGWRSGFLALTVLSLVVVPFILWGFKLPTTATVLPAEVVGMERKAALASRPFWTILTGFVFVGISVPAVIPHMVPVLADAGVNPAAAAGIASLIGVGVIIGRLSIGFCGLCRLRYRHLRGADLGGTGLRHDGFLHAGRHGPLRTLGADAD